jgi:hypothetical protein
MLNSPPADLPARDRLAQRLTAACAVVVVALSVATFVYWIRAFWACTVDDTFIFLRYAANLAAGHGPTWNPGGPPVEGYTSVLWVVLLSIPHTLGLDAVHFAKGFGVFASLATLALSYGLVLRLEAGSATRHLAAASAVFFIVCFSRFEWHAVSGMDTAPFTAHLLGLCVLLTLAAIRPTRASFAGLAVVGLLAALTRPEGNLALAAGVAVLCTRLKPEDRKRLLGTLAVLFVLPAAIYFLWRLTYYRQLLPLPVYVKSSGSLLGLKPVLAFGSYLALPLGGFFLVGLWRRAGSVGPAVCAVLSIVFYYAFPLHLMGYGWRYLAPVVPPLAIVSACGVNALVELGAARWKGPVTPLAAPILASLLVFALGAVIMRDASTQLWIANRMVAGLELAHLPLGRKLASLGGTDRILALSDAGAVPYLSGWETIDTLGLNDPHIARTGHDPAYVLAKKPDLVVLISKDPNRFVPALAWEKDLHDACVAAGMRKIGSLGDPGYRLWLMARPGGSVARELAGWTEFRNRRFRQRSRGR